GPREESARPAGAAAQVEHSRRAPRQQAEDGAHVEQEVAAVVVGERLVDRVPDFRRGGVLQVIDLAELRHPASPPWPRPPPPPRLVYHPRPRLKAAWPPAQRRDAGHRSAP